MSPSRDHSSVAAMIRSSTLRLVIRLGRQGGSGIKVLACPDVSRKRDVLCIAWLTLHMQPGAFSYKLRLPGLASRTARV